MALGSVAAFAYAADDPVAWDFLNNELIEQAAHRRHRRRRT